MSTQHGSLHRPSRATARLRRAVTRLGAAGAVTLLLAATAAAVGPGGRRPPDSPVIVDGAGRVVGVAVGLGDLLYAAVAIHVGGAVRLVYLGREQFAASTARIGFESNTCLGERFVLQSMSLTTGAPTFYADAAIGPGNVLHGPVGDPVSRTIRSIWVPFLSPACRIQPPASTDVFAVVDLLDLDVFEPPFRME